MLLRQLNERDLEEVTRLHHQVWHETYCPKIMPPEVLRKMTLAEWRENWQKNLSGCNRDYHLGVEDEDGRLIAFASFGENLDPDDSAEYPGRILRIYVLKKYQRHGIGKMLIMAGAEYLIGRGIAAVIVHALEANTAACGFYEHLGARLIKHSREKRFGCIIPELIYGWQNILTLK